MLELCSLKATAQLQVVKSIYSESIFSILATELIAPHKLTVFHLVFSSLLVRKFSLEFVNWTQFGSPLHCSLCLTLGACIQVAGDTS